MNRIPGASGLAAGPAIFVSMPGVTGGQDLLHNLRIVICWKSTGGDTCENSEIVGNVLSKEPGINVKVDAVGAMLRRLEGDALSRTISITDFSSSSAPAPEPVLWRC